MPNSVGVPTTRSMGGAFKNYGVGFLGGTVYKLATGLLGNGLLGSLVAPVMAGSVVKGQAGDTISTVAGFLAAHQLNLFSMGARQSGGRGEM